MPWSSKPRSAKKKQEKKIIIIIITVKKEEVENFLASTKGSLFNLCHRKWFNQFARFARVTLAFTEREHQSWLKSRFRLRLTNVTFICITIALELKRQLVKKKAWTQVNSCCSYLNERITIKFAFLYSILTDIHHVTFRDQRRTACC